MRHQDKDQDELKNLIRSDAIPRIAQGKRGGQEAGKDALNQETGVLLQTKRPSF